MNLNIVRYKHYGGVMTTDGEPTIIYWTFFELSNGKVIENQYFDYKNGNWNDLYFYYTDCYTFGEDFFDWWNRYMADNHEQDEIPKITKAEEELVELFWYKNIEKKREVATEIVYL
tara:strand:- start:217 stop:564 length:348 start_codon:yes stop_codon:yes gene_type:complete